MLHVFPPVLKVRMITRGFLCLFKQVPYLCASSTTAVQLSAVGTRALFFILVINRTSREKICLFFVCVFFFFFLGLFLPVRFMIDALRQRLKPAPVMWRRADVCFISREHSLV